MKTVKQYISEVEAMNMPENMKEKLMSMELWSNDACRGYVLAASRIIGLDAGKTKDLETALDICLNRLSPAEAENLNSTE